METLNKLTKITTKQQKRVGRGYGSKAGGHTTGRGAKGDLVRGKSKLTFDGTKIKKSWIKRLPFLRGKHRTLSRGQHFNINLAHLEKWYKAGETVSPETLTVKSGVKLNEMGLGVKILATGELTKALNFKDIFFSETAKSKIVAAGGKID